MSIKLLLLLCMASIYLVAVIQYIQFHRCMAKFDQLGYELDETENRIAQSLHKHQIDTLQATSQNMQQSTGLIRTEMLNELRAQRQEIGKSLDHISGRVEERLASGFEKTNQTFVDIVKRLAIIDAAQDKITKLSANVVDLQEVLNDKRSRGAFGEVQLSAIVRNVIPETNLSFQHTLSNGRRADCMMFLPEPTGNIVIDAKFPLETFQRLQKSDNKNDQAQFRTDIRKHINDIASRYIISGETAEGAIMFIPAEAVFAEIHSNFQDLVDYAHQQRVWLVSPTTLVAVLTTARAVLKDDATKKQVHVIQEHLRFLSKDFERFQKRMDNLSRHIKQAHDDVTDVNVSARKISSRFEKIEQVETDALAHALEHEDDHS
jgi:DNA recombination protein RmuC